MHIPNGFLDAPTSVATGVVAAATVGVALRGSRRELDDRTAPLAGLAATFIFAAQMLNFPVGAGTSGHLLGGTIAAILVGPWTGILCMSVVLIVQCLLFSDGGITALGANILLMGVLSVVVGWLVFRGLQAVLPKRIGLTAPLAAVAAYLSVPIAAVGFVALYGVGGTAPIPIDDLAKAMIGWHALIGFGEAAITGLVVASIVAVRPDLVYGARRVLGDRTVEIRTSQEVAA